MIETVHDIKFDLLVTLSIIKEDRILLKMFNDNIGLDIKFISYQHKNGILEPKVSNYIKDLFDKLIVKNDKFLNQYKSLIKESVVETKPVVKFDKNVKRLPRKFGKIETLEKIEAQGEITPLDELLLSLNDLRNGYEKMLKKCIHDIHREEKKLTEEKIIILTRKIKNLIKHIND